MGPIYRLTADGWPAERLTAAHTDIDHVALAPGSVLGNVGEDSGYLLKAHRSTDQRAEIEPITKVEGISDNEILPRKTEGGYKRDFSAYKLGQIVLK